MIRNREEAIHAAAATTHNIVGFCQGQVHAWYLAPAVGDFDHDGAADAEDGWKAEPEWAKHYGDRNPPPGVPLSFLGGSHDNGHRAMSFPHGKVRSTDFSTSAQRWSPGFVGTANSIAAVEHAMGVTYVGWSETISGVKIPLAHPPAPPKPPKPDPTRGPHLDTALDKAKDALNELRAADHRTRDTSARGKMIEKAKLAARRTKRLLKKIPFLNR